MGFNVFESVFFLSEEENIYVFFRVVDLHNFRVGAMVVIWCRFLFR